MKRVKLNSKVLIVIIAIPVVFFSYIAFESNDADADEVIDWFDNCPNVINPNQEDFDGDKLGDVCDLDDDNDGIVNAIDAFRLNPEEWDDFDLDGIGANEDEDDDNDGILDINDTSPSTVTTQLSMKYLDLIENCAIMDSGYSRNICYQDIFVSLIEKGENGFEIIEMAFIFDKRNIIDDCHFTAHHVGYATFQQNPDLTENIMNAEFTCRSGFHHGLLSAFFDNLKKEGKDISSWYKTICDEFVDTEKYEPCIHGIGHGLVFYYDDDLRQPLDSCHELPEEESVLSCVHGVFMQYTDDKLTNSTSWEKDIPEICLKIELTPIDKKRCYLQIGNVLAFKTNHNLIPALEFCTVIKDQISTIHCYVGVMKEFLSSESAKELRKCDLIEDQKGILDCQMKVFTELWNREVEKDLGKVPFN